ncbi:hypothetical protein D3C73_460480 [compost metagenome]
MVGASSIKAIVKDGGIPTDAQGFRRSAFSARTPMRREMNSKRCDMHPRGRK